MIFAIDFDGTVVQDDFPNVGNDAKYAEIILKQLVEKGNKLILYTMRSYDSRYNGITQDTLTPAINWFKKRNIELAAVNQNIPSSNFSSSPKIYADYYIDDRNFGCPLISIKDIKNGNKKHTVNWGLLAIILNYKKLI